MYYLLYVKGDELTSPEISCRTLCLAHQGALLDFRPLIAFSTSSLVIAALRMELCSSAIMLSWMEEKKGPIRKQLRFIRFSLKSIRNFNVSVSWRQVTSFIYGLQKKKSESALFLPRNVRFCSLLPHNFLFAKTNFNSKAEWMADIFLNLKEKGKLIDFICQLDQFYFIIMSSFLTRYM